MRRVWRVMAAGGGMGRAAALAALVLLAGGGLLALSGWFIMASAIAGLTAGLAGGAMFDVFRPAASVRGLALIRTAARYAERMLGHDATLRAVAGLRSEGLRWSVAGLDFAPDRRIGTSNAALGGAMRVAFDGPGMLAILPLDRLEAAAAALGGRA